MSQLIDSNPPLGLDSEQDREYLPARMLNEFVYCPRLFYLEHVDGLFVHNNDTIEGVSKHRRVDQKTDELPSADAATQDFEKIHARSVTLSSDHFGIIAKMDLIEVQGNQATPVDYKRGSPRKLPDGSLDAWDPERVQVCAQAIVLRENNYQCTEAVIFFWETRQRVRIPITDELIEQTRLAIQQANSLSSQLVAPAPLVDSPKCPRCSLVSICLPDETSRCTRYDSTEPEGLRQPLLFEVGLPREVQIDQTDEQEQKPIRQLVTVRDEAKPVYLNTQGMSVGVSGQVLTIKEKDKKIQEIRLKDVSQLNLFGAVQVSTQAIQILLQEDIPLAYFSFGGWFQGMTQAVGLRNILWRREQFRKADQPRFCLSLAKELVIGKIRNQRTMIQRNHIEPPMEVLDFLKSLMIEAKRVHSIGSLLGVEGVAARTYFSAFSGLIKDNATKKMSVASDEDVVALATSPEGTDAFRFDFEKRNRRPPRDPINALLSLGYGVLAKDLTVMCATVGLDPYLGFYHQPRFGRPSLALDMMEPFRPLIVDSAVISAINQRMVTLDDFISAGDAVALTAKGRKSFYLAYEQRMDQLVTHPMFGYRVSYRRLIEIQVRLLARLLTGEITRYPVFVTR
ncbi:MAG: CRISPR-associated endonuclease Cas1 [Planctomycetes bacterium]|nr:CRISPR-associated endonuclease Cas1 [Planctomycetota bacterium]